MLSGYDFSNCDIPVRLNLFYWLICKSMWRFFWERQCSEEEATQSECNGDRTRSEFLLRSEVLMANWDPTQSTNWKTKSMCRFSVRCWDLLLVTWLKLEAQTGCRVSDGCAERRPGDLRATSPISPTSPTDGRQRRAGDDLIQVRGGRCHTTNLCRERKENRLWQNIVKAQLGGDWLIAPSLPVHRQLHFSHL